MRNQNALVWLWLTIVVIALDHLTKWWASTHLVFNQEVAIAPLVNFKLLHNPGAAFSLFAEAGGWQRWVLTALALVVSSLLIGWLAQLSRRQRWLASALALIIGGALGNAVDRVLYGYVVDFIDVYYQTWHWPAFNVADSAISVGAVMLLIDAIFKGNPHSK